MNREQKGAAIAEIAADIAASEAIFAVDYRGITVAQAAELRGRLRESDTKFRVVKNSLTERAADETGRQVLKPLLAGPTALAFVTGDVALAAKAIAEYARATQLLPFKGGLLGDDALAVEQLMSLSRLPARDVLHGQLVGIVASPLSGLVRTLSALTGGLAVALGQLREKMESGEARPAPATAVAGAPVDAEAAAADTADEEIESAAETSAEQGETKADASAGEQTETAEANKED
jgi:large subunit ribosomal protein L10